MLLSKSRFYATCVRIMSPAWLVAAFAALVLTQLTPDLATAQEKRSPWFYHAVYGRYMLDDDLEFEDEDYDIPLLGFDAQQPIGGAKLVYGIEGGGFFSWESEERTIFVTSAGDSGARVSAVVDINSLLFDAYAGGYLSFEPMKGIRIWAGAGPLILWGWRETESTTADDEILISEEESGFGAGVYARMGIDIIFKNNLGFTTGARITETSLTFDDPAGEVNVEGWQFYVGLVYRQ